MPAVSLAPRAPGLNFAALTFQGGGSHGTWRISRSHLFLSPCATNSNLLLVRKDGRGSESPQGALQSHPLYFGVRPAEPLTSSTHAQLCDLEHTTQSFSVPEPSAAKCALQHCLPSRIPGRCEHGFEWKTFTKAPGAVNALNIRGAPWWRYYRLSVRIWMDLWAQPHPGRLGASQVGTAYLECDSMLTAGRLELRIESPNDPLLSLGKMCWFGISNHSLPGISRLCSHGEPLGAHVHACACTHTCVPIEMPAAAWV